MITLGAGSRQEEGPRPWYTPSEVGGILAFALVILLAVATLVITRDAAAVGIVVNPVLAPAAWLMGRSTGSRKLSTNDQVDG